MTPDLQQYIAAGKKLSPDDREIAALALQEIDPDEQAAVDEAWDQTIDRRLQELMDGTVTPVSGRETIAMARAMIKGHRS